MCHASSHDFLPLRNPPVTKSSSNEHFFSAPKSATPMRSYYCCITSTRLHAVRMVYLVSRGPVFFRCVGPAPLFLAMHHGPWLVRDGGRGSPFGGAPLAFQRVIGLSLARVTAPQLWCSFILRSIVSCFLCFVFLVLRRDTSVMEGLAKLSMTRCAKWIAPETFFVP